MSAFARHARAPGRDYRIHAQVRRDTSYIASNSRLQKWKRFPWRIVPDFVPLETEERCVSQGKRHLIVVFLGFLRDLAKRC